jgi:hypothetical protein
MTVAEEGIPTAREEREEFRVPRVLRAAEVLCADGVRMRGRVFLPATAEAHPGTMRAEEWMNDPTEFYPFLPDGEGSPTILSKAQAVMVTVMASADQDGTFESAPAPLRRVHVECGSIRIEGEVVMDLPAQQSRVLDLLNREEPFLTIRDGELHHLVHKSYITRVTEPPGSGHGA